MRPALRPDFGERRLAMVAATTGAVRDLRDRDS